MGLNSPAGTAVATAVAVVGAAAVWVWRNQSTLAFRRPFNEWTFTHMSALMPTDPVSRGAAAGSLRSKPRALSSFRYEHAGHRYTLEQLHARTFTTGFAVVHDGALIHESYPGRFASPDTRFQLFSLTKSVTSILIGCAVQDGAIPSLDVNVALYVPELAGSAYDGPTIEHLLHMTSGAGELEDYEDPKALINRFERAIAGSQPLMEIVRSAPHLAEPGTSFNYSTIDTQVLGWVLEAATAMPIAQYAAERLWSRIGAERDAYYFLTRRRPRTAIGGGSLNATVRDVARVGLLMAHGGRAEGEQVVPERWVERSRGVGLAHLEVGALKSGGAPHYGYANQWWTIGGTRRAFTGLGIHGQYLWVDPEADVVVVKTSAWPIADDEELDHETYTALSTLVEHVAAAA